MKKKKNELISWTDAMRIRPDVIIPVFLQIVVAFWRKENVLPRDVNDVMLKMDHSLYNTCRFHLHEMNQDNYIGVWDETPFHVSFHTSKPLGLDHGDYRHDFQLFLRSFLRETENYDNYYQQVSILRKIVSNFPVLQWKCEVCHAYNKWASGLIQKSSGHASIIPSLLMCLLVFDNKRCHTEQVWGANQLNPMLQSVIVRFFLNFNQICEQTNTDAQSILEPLIVILEKYASVYTIDQIHEFEHECARDMKTFLYTEFKYLKTKSIEIHSFPRDMMMARDLFPMLVACWKKQENSTFSPGILMLLCDVLLEDRFLHKTDNHHVLIVKHKSHDEIQTLRIMTREEEIILKEHHPLLRPSVITE